jgi:hypothetical protein
VNAQDNLVISIRFDSRQVRGLLPEDSERRTKAMRGPILHDLKNRGKTSKSDKSLPIFRGCSIPLTDAAILLPDMSSPTLRWNLMCYHRQKVLRFPRFPSSTLYLAGFWMGSTIGQKFKPRGGQSRPRQTARSQRIEFQ